MSTQKCERGINSKVQTTKCTLLSSYIHRLQLNIKVYYSNELPAFLMLKIK